MSRELPITGMHLVAMETCHSFGTSWTDPRTGVTYDPPKPKAKSKKKTKKKTKKSK